MKKTAFLIYQILVNRENDANTSKEKESATLRRRKNLDFKSSKGKSDFTEQNCFGLSGKIKKTVDRTCVY